MSDILLIGPSFGGKTTMLYSYKGKKAPEGATGKAGERVKTKGVLWTGLGGDEFKEIGGIMLHNDSCIDAINHEPKRKILFIFDGTEFIKQALYPEEGGEIWARWLYYCSQSKIQQREVHFVATHNDCTDGMNIKILECVRTANEEYASILGGGAKRYDNIRFQEPYFHCINAKSQEEVKRLFDKIR